MKPLWPIFVVLTILCWGAYVPTLHNGQMAFGPRPNALRAFMFVGVAYFIVSAAVLAYVYVTRAEPMTMTSRGVAVSTIAGILGAVGALGIVFALMYDGRPVVVAPIVFAGAPIVNTLVAMLFHPPKETPSMWFFAGIVLAAVGAAMVLANKPV